MKTRVSDTLFYYVGELPPPLTIEFINGDGNLDTSLAGAGMSAKTKIDTEAEVAVTMTNNGDGTGTVDWPNPTSRFIDPDGASEPTITIDIEITQAPLVWFWPRITIPIRRR